MIPVFTQNDAFSLDEFTITSNYLSEAKLMDNAGRSIAQFIVENIHNSFHKKFVVIAGPGNNGGDAIICHYYLHHYGVSSQLLLFSKKQKEIWIFKQYSIDDDSIEFFTNEYQLDPETWYVDGIFGIGLKRAVTGIYKELVENLSDCPQIISIDIPSGVYCDTGLTADNNIHANFTLTMGYPKLGHFFNDGLESCGELHVFDIGFKPLIKLHDYIKLVSRDDVRNLAPVYSENTHKYNRGKLLTIAGSSGYTGACILAVKAAGKTGAGIIKAIVPESLNTIFESALIEAITIPLNGHKPGTFTIENINDIINEIQWADAVLFGPGLNIEKESAEWMAQVLRKIQKPLILDASGFLPLIANKIQISELPIETILTPHYSEFSRIFDLDVRTVMDDPISAVKKVISLLDGRVLILKGPTNIILTSKGNILIMNHGSSLLATAGTGDVLSGILGALTAQGLFIDDASIFATYLHGECAHQYNELVSYDGLTATDLSPMIPHALETIQYVS